MPTKIEWTHMPGATGESWNPLRARDRETGKVGWHCEKVSQGCAHCYSEVINKRFGTGHSYTAASRADVEVFLDEDVLEKPLHWRKPRAVFVCSMTDLFHDDINILDSTFVREVFAIMALCPQHTFQVLTKRPRLMHATLSGEFGFADSVCWAVHGICDDMGIPSSLDWKWPLPNVWLGVTAENQRTADERIPLLLQTPAAVRFVSCEPLLEAINIQPWLNQEYDTARHKSWCGITRGLDWVIVGGESGPGARPMHPDWALSLRDQCVAADVSFFFKQWGDWLPNDSRCGSDPGYHYNSKHICVNRAGDVFDGWLESHGDNVVVMAKATKKAAGRLLDGKEWNQFPKGRSR